MSRHRDQPEAGPSRGTADQAANLAGQLPARLLYTWTPDLTNTPAAFCLWEAEGPDQVQASLVAGGILEWMSAGIIPIEETDWLA